VVYLLFDWPKTPNRHLTVFCAKKMTKLCHCCNEESKTSCERYFGLLLGLSELRQPYWTAVLDLLGISRSKERDLLSVLLIYPRIFLRVFIAYRLFVGFLVV